MTTKMTGVPVADGPVTPNLSVLAEPLVAAAGTQEVEPTGMGGRLTGLTKQMPETVLNLEVSDGASCAADPGWSP